MKPILLLAFLTSTALQASILITVSPQLQTFAPGATTQVQVAISGLGHNAAPSLGAFDLNLAFDPTILSFTGLTFGDPINGDQLNLSGTGTISDFTNAPAGQLEFDEISFDSPTLLDTTQPDHFTLATLQFKAIKAGSSALLPSLNSLSDSQGSPLNAGIQSGRITVTTTPEPATQWTLLPLAAAILLLPRLVKNRDTKKSLTDRI